MSAAQSTSSHFSPASEGKDQRPFQPCHSPDSLEVSWKESPSSVCSYKWPLRNTLAIELIMHFFTVFSHCAVFSIILLSAVLLFSHPSKSGHIVLSFPVSACFRFSLRETWLLLQFVFLTNWSSVSAHLHCYKLKSPAALKSFYSILCLLFLI